MPGPTAGARAGRMAVSVRILGAQKSAANIRRMSKAARKKFFEAMIDVSEQILQHSKDTYVPYLTGDLERSGSIAVHPGRYPSVEIGFGGPAAAYAEIQHENVLFTHPNGGSAKYLEFAVRDFEPRISHELETAVRSEIRMYDMRGIAGG